MGLGSLVSPAGGLPFFPSFSLTPGQPQPRTILFSRSLLLSGKDVSNMKAALVLIYAASEAGSVPSTEMSCFSSARTRLGQRSFRITASGDQGGIVLNLQGPARSDSVLLPGQEFGFGLNRFTRCSILLTISFSYCSPLCLPPRMPQLTIINHIPFNHQGIFWNDSIIQHIMEACLCF